MMRSVLCLALAAGASAFAPSLPMSTARATKSISGMKMQNSDSVPFLPRPAALDGKMVGDVGFDPLGFTTKYDIKWLREAELKHGRVCMLAATGLLVQDVYQFPGTVATFGDAKVTALHNAAVSQGAMQQLLVWLGFLELFGFVAIVQMLQGSDRQPGDFGFDPLDLAKDQSKFARRQLVELKNGRLAMLGFSGMLVGYQVTGNGPTHPFGP
mmetsp:Transcript_52056/g.123283  ORF Transcript_52056/g.123283 Transcript_52056/m.123283 type:complete len:212 (-) Transcript_52056:109-744(-)